MKYIVFLAFSLFSQVVCYSDNIVVYEQEFSFNSLSNTFHPEQYAPSSNEEVLRIEIEYLATNGYSFRGINPTSSNYTVMIDVAGEYQIDTPTHGVERGFSRQVQMFAPAGEVIAGNVGDVTFSGILNSSRGSTGFDQYVGTGTFEIEYDWASISDSDPNTFSYKINQLGTANVYAVRHYVLVVPEPAGAGLVLVLLFGMVAKRARSVCEK